MRMIALATSAAAAALLAGAALAQSQTPAERATAPAAPSGTIQDEVNNTTQPPRNPDGSVSSTMTTTVATPAPAPADADTATMPPASAPSASSMGTNTAATEPVASVGTQVVANAPIPDTPENRAKYGGPDSHGGKKTKARGN